MHLAETLSIHAILRKHGILLLLLLGTLCEELFPKHADLERRGNVLNVFLFAKSKGF